MDLGTLASKPGHTFGSAVSIVDVRDLHGLESPSPVHGDDTMVITVMAGARHLVQPIQGQKVLLTTISGPHRQYHHQRNHHWQ